MYSIKDQSTHMRVQRHRSFLYGCPRRIGTSQSLVAARPCPWYNTAMKREERSTCNMVHHPHLRQARRGKGLMHCTTFVASIGVHGTPCLRQHAKTHRLHSLTRSNVHAHHNHTVRLWYTPSSDTKRTCCLSICDRVLMHCTQQNKP